MNVSRRDAMVSLVAALATGCYIGISVSPRCTAPPPGPPPRSAFEERGPPTKQELGQAGWTLLHTMAANFPDEPTKQQQTRVESFLAALGFLYPCKLCAAHFRGYQQQHAIASRSRETLSMWLCDAHNEVNVRNGKESFYCDMGVLDARWKDCGCGNSTKSGGSPAPAVEAAAALPPRRRRPRRKLS